jgi:CheY-like chemotaxis protein
VEYSSEKAGDMAEHPVLIVDDEVDLLELFSLALKKLPIPILTARDGDTAMKLMEEHVPAVVVLDIAMPHPNGLELLQFIRNNPLLAGTRVIIFTAAPTRLDKRDADLADMVISKPSTPKTIEQMVRNLLEA